MSDPSVIATYARAGGMPPADDEHLAIREDGGWSMWRTMGGSRVGAFRGRLSPGDQGRLRAAIDGVADGTDPVPSRPPRPDSAHEAFTAGERRLDVPAGSTVAGAWAPLARLLRGWSESLTDQPVAALALEAADASGPPRLVHLGSEPLRLWPAGVRVDVYARDEDGVIRDRASGGALDEDDLPHGTPVEAAAGWSLELPAGRPLTIPEGGTLEVWTLVDVEGPDGPVRARLTAGGHGSA